MMLANPGGVRKGPESQPKSKWLVGDLGWNQKSTRACRSPERSHGKYLIFAGDDEAGWAFGLRRSVPAPIFVDRVCAPAFVRAIVFAHALST